MGKTFCRTLLKKQGPHSLPIMTSFFFSISNNFPPRYPSLSNWCGYPYRNLELKVVKKKNATFYWLDRIYFSIINTSSKEEKLPNLNNKRRAKVIPLREIWFLLFFFKKFYWRMDIDHSLFASEKKKEGLYQSFREEIGNWSSLLMVGVLMISAITFSPRKCPK